LLDIVAYLMMQVSVNVHIQHYFFIRFCFAG